MTAAGITFLSWYREALAAGVAAAPGTGPALDATLPAQALLPISVAITGVAATTFDAYLYSPGDVAGFDVKQVIRTDPAAGAINVETSFLPLVEFARPDLPWMLTPTTPQVAQITDADPRSGLRPWLVLVVIPNGSFTVALPSTASGAAVGASLPVLTTTTDQLPDLTESWLWAHAQVLTTGAAGETIDGIIASTPERALSRLIAPRRLQPNTAYTAFVVPAFDAGRDAGLGLSPSNPTLGPAWQTGGGSVQLPVYFSWSFATGAGGDFESLARKLQPYVSAQAGVRPLDISDPGTGFPTPPSGTDWTLNLEGALVGADIEPGQWPASIAQAAFQAALASQVDGPPGTLAPPTYGSVPAAFQGTLSSGAGPLWLRTLNLDPRYRVLASLGAAVIQKYQEALMASAWAQAGDLASANQRLAGGQLAREATTRLYTQRIGGTTPVLSDDRLLQLTVAVHGQVAAAPGTTGGASVVAALSAHAALKASTTVAFRRAARPLGPLAKRTVVPPLPMPVLELANNTVLATPALVPVSGQASIESISNGASLETLTPAFVSTPTFPWEGSPTAGGISPVLSIPFGFMSDLVVLGSNSALGRACDFSGEPQLGWTQFGDAAALAGPSLNSTPALTYVDFASRNGMISFAPFESTNYPDFHWYAQMHWIPGYPLDSGGSPPSAVGVSPGSPGLPGPPPLGYGLSSWAVAATDLNGDGNIDVLFIWSTGTSPHYQDNPGETTSPDTTYIMVGLGLDSTGAMTGGYTPLQALERGGASPGAALSITAMGRQACVLQGNQLSVITLDGNGNVVSSQDCGAFGAELPPDFVAGAIASAAFGATGMDLVYCYAAGIGGQLRAAYALAFDVQADGSVGGWGDPLPLPVHGASQMQILLGVMTSEGAALRTQQTSAFRAAAATTQTRQIRVLGWATPPPTPAAVDTAPLVAQLRTQLNPATTVPVRVLGDLQFPSPINPSQVSDSLQRAVCSPYFPQAMYESFLEIQPNWFLPGASLMPDNRATLVQADGEVVEAFLVGLSAEMARALLWHGFPGNLKATFFDRFWNGIDTSGSLLFDISAIAGWSPTSDLGTHSPGAGATEPLVLLVRGELLRRIPNVTIYAAPAETTASGRTLNVAGRLDPIFTGQIDPDIVFLGFDLKATEARGDGGTPGWYIVFQEHPTAPRFGLNEPPNTTSFGTQPTQWRSLDWSQVVSSAAQYAALTYITCANAPLEGVELTDSGSGTVHRFGFSAAHMAHILFEPAVQVAIHGSLLLPTS